MIFGGKLGCFYVFSEENLKPKKYVLGLKTKKKKKKKVDSGREWKVFEMKVCLY